MLSFTPGGLGFVRGLWLNRVLSVVLLLYFFTTIPSVEAVTVRTCGPFDVSFYGPNESYTDSSGVTYTGTIDHNWTTTEMDDVAAMVQIWDRGIANASGPRQIKMNLMWNSVGGFLGMSSSSFTGDGTTALTYAEKLWRKGQSASNSYADVFIRFDSSTSWNVGVGTPGSGIYDFRSVVVHEIGHALGFTTTYNSTTDKWWSGGITAWDTHLRDAASGGNMPAVNSVGTPGNFIQTPSSGHVYFDGTNADAANGGNRVAIYAPSSFESGSSLSHLDESTFPNALLSPYLYDTQMVRQPTYLEWQMMSDLGWTLDTSTKTWSGGAGDLQWGTDNNWNSFYVPLSYQTVAFTNSGLSSGVTINIGGDAPVGNLSFNSNTTFTIGGSLGTLIIGAGGITRTATSSGTQTISRPVALGGNAVWDLSGSGSFNVSGGISGGYSLEKRGTGTLYLSGANTYTGTTRVQNGSLIVTGGSTASTAFDVVSGAALSFSGGSYNLGSSSITNAGAININGATLTFNTTKTVPGTVNFSSGTITGTGAVTFSNTLNWTNGTMSGGGTTITPAGIYFSGNFDPLINNRTLTNSGTITFAPGTLCYLHGSNGAVFNNNSGGLVDLQGDNQLINDGGFTPVLNNAGTFRKSVGANPAGSGVWFSMNNTGTVDVQSGMLSFQNSITQLVGATLTGGTWKVRANSRLDFLPGGGITTNQGNVTLDGPGSTFNEIDVLANNPGSFSVTGGRDFTTVGNLVNSGTLTVGAGSDVIVNGTLTGWGNVVVYGNLWTTKLRQNYLNVASGGKITIRPIVNGILSSDTLLTVPEPGTLGTLLIAITAVLWIKGIRGVRKHFHSV